MKLNPLFAAALITVGSIATALPSRADSLKAFCTYTLNGSTEPEVSMPCTFYQSQGHIVLNWEDGAVSDFMPEKDQVMTYRDQYGGMVYRIVGEGENSFQLEKGTIQVTW